MATPSESPNSVAPLTFRHRIGWLGFVLLPLFAIGIGTMNGGFQIQFKNPKSAKPGAGWALMALGLGCTVFSLGGILFVWDITIAPATGLITRRRGTLGFSRTATFALSDFNAVLVSRHRAFSNSSTLTRFHVSLMGPNYRSVYLTEYSHADQALAKARDASACTGLPVIDRTREE